MVGPAWVFGDLFDCHRMLTNGSHYGMRCVSEGCLFVCLCCLCCLFVLFVLFVCLFVCLCCLFVLFVCVVCLFVCLFVCLCCLFVVFVCLFVLFVCVVLNSNLRVTAIKILLNND